MACLGESAAFQEAILLVRKQAVLLVGATGKTNIIYNS